MANTRISDERLLAEVEGDLLRTMPPKATRRHDPDEHLNWLGRAWTVLARWDSLKAITFEYHVRRFHSAIAIESNEGFREIMLLLHRARTDLLMRTLGPTSISVSPGRVFEYFDEVRKILELATEETLFVDPYLDADFVSRYLPHVQSGVTITSEKKLPTLLPAVNLFAQQHGHVVKVRSTAKLHDRFLFVDRTSCYHSGASFKDGARNAGTILTQITDAFKAMWDTYDTLWTGARKDRE